VIGETDPPEDLIGVNYGDDSRFRAIFHIAKTVTSEVSGHNISELDFPPEVATSLVEGLTNYYVSIYEKSLPYSYEIRPCQFMYGKVAGDTEPTLYMVDVDFALSQCEKSNVGDLMLNLGYNIDFLKEYLPHPLLRPVAEKMLAYI